ncbi:MAG: hypothetical protein CSA55_05875 [Ilumatobacter coccineus]|uniref:Uncharacterized protein n=1 Tax=Ilumatobacter coccineus TaxID=467094 RepID=A0A2G6K6X6_9ACTN|nr:MAG: hypothetical protein CSA55_05875 [Ilumatobacter coccineus]
MNEQPTPTGSDELADLYSGVAVHATADREHQAALELLTLVMLADCHLDEAEIDAIREITVDWRDDELRLDTYLDEALTRVRQAIKADTMIELLDDIDRRISSRVLRRALYSAAHEVAHSDQNVPPLEGSILAQIAVRFS